MCCDGENENKNKESSGFCSGAELQVKTVVVQIARMTKSPACTDEPWREIDERGEIDGMYLCQGSPSLSIEEVENSMDRK